MQICLFTNRSKILLLYYCSWLKVVKLKHECFMFIEKRPFNINLDEKDISFHFYGIKLYFVFLSFAAFSAILLSYLS